MKKRKLIVERILSGIFTLLGFASCSGTVGGGDEPYICEYGCPTTKFQVKGTVTSEIGKPLKDIQVIIKGDGRMYFETKGAIADTVYTNEKGEYLSDEGSVISLESKPGNSDISTTPTQKVVFRDKEDTYKSDSTAFINMSKKQVEKGSGWYNGKYILNADKQLKKNK